MQPVSDSDQTLLRQRNLMSANEVAYVQGDLLVVVEVTTQNKRVLGPAATYINESVKRQVLKG